MGGWICPNCGDVVFAQHKLCRVCQTAKPGLDDPKEEKGGEAKGSSGKDKKGPPQFTYQMPGDWVCPNLSCQALCFAKRDSCRSCGTQRPSSSKNATECHLFRASGASARGRS